MEAYPHYLGSFTRGGVPPLHRILYLQIAGDTPTLLTRLSNLASPQMRAIPAQNRPTPFVALERAKCGLAMHDFPYMPAGSLVAACLGIFFLFWQSQVWARAPHEPGMT